MRGSRNTVGLKSARKKSTAVIAPGGEGSILEAEDHLRKGSAADYPNALDWGFPESLKKPSNGSIKLIAILRNQGLTTADIKQVLAGRAIKKILGKIIEHREAAITGLLADPIFRVLLFVSVAERRGVQPHYLSLSPEFAILGAFVPQWSNLVLDEEVLRAECDRWDEIRQRLEEGVFKDAKASTFGVFMLWIQIKASLERWEALDATAKEVVAHAAFALSTLAMDDWFVRKATELVPILKGDLGDLLLGPSSNEQAHVDTDEETISREEADANGRVAQRTRLAATWAAMGDDLASLSGDWGGAPSPVLAERLITLGKRASDVLPEIPEDKKAPEVLLQEGEALLKASLLKLVGTESMSWLGAEDIAHVMARWDLRRLTAQDDQAILDLVEDADLALRRLEAAVIEMKEADARFIESRQLAEHLEVEATTRSPTVRKLELSNRSLKAREDSLTAERKRTDMMLFVLASASPEGEAFDPATDYVAKTMEASTDHRKTPDHSGSAEVEAEPSAAEVAANLPPHVEASALPALAESGRLADPLPPPSGEELVALDQEPLAPLPLNALKAETALTSVIVNPSHETAADADRSLQVGSSAIDTPSDKPEFVSDRDPAAVFSDVAAERCQPIWLLLRQSKPALAFQFAVALLSVAPELRVPYPSLLRSVALAQGLAASDGPLAVTIGESLAEFEASWFEPEEVPTNWCTALNLLLIAATLRPMVLAPLSSASVIAAYRHLDGRHSAVLQLVKTVEDLSERLTRFSIGPSVLRSAADQSSLRAKIEKLCNTASDWLYVRAPNKKIRYAPASKVWLYWLRPGEAIHSLMAPVSVGSTADRSAVKAAIENLSDYVRFTAILTETDRRKLGRRGPDIEAGALEHLWGATCEAVDIAKVWLDTIEPPTEPRDQLRALVSEMQLAFQNHGDSAVRQLERPWEGDAWGIVRAASAVLVKEVKTIAGMFSASDEIPVAEPMAEEILTRDLLWVPGAFVGADWAVESEGATLLEVLTAWSRKPIDTEVALAARASAGDIAGAEVLLDYLTQDRDRTLQAQVIERAREQWLQELQRQLLQARRATEVGLAYGYLNDAERAACESGLSALEVGLRDSGRFDHGVSKVASIQARIEACKADRVHRARKSFERDRPRLSDEVASQLEAPLERSDIHTFNELMQRVRQGADPWPERDLRRDAFTDFYPNQQQELIDQLGRLSPADLETLIRSGGHIGSVSFDLDGDERARQSAEQTYRIWATSASRQSMTGDSLRRILEAIGFTVYSLKQEKSTPHKLPCWTLQAAPLDDREICPVPHFGSRAQGRYRVLCVWDRMTPEDFLQRIGEETQQSATIVMTLSRTSQRLWTELARTSKERQRSFLVLDESMLLFLLSQQGSRLATWFSVALPFTYSEPYDASAGYVPAEMFYGRASELESVRRQGGCYFIYGGRQLGKTALLRRAEKTFHDPSAEHFAVWIDLLAQGIGERRRVSEVWLAIFEKLRDLKIVGLDLPSVNPAKPGSVDAFLGSIKTFLAARPGRRILLLLDEADRFFEQDGRQEGGYAETRRLKQVMDETERRFKVVFAGLHNVLRTVSTSNQPLGHFNEAVRVGPLMDEREIRAAEELITRPIEAAGFKFAERSLVMRVLAQTNYYPSLIQLYCTQLLRHLRENRLRRGDAVRPRFVIEEADIESVFSGRPLRDAIRAKFRLTLQLDDRYEVIANAIGLEALSADFDHAEGVDWRKIRNDCATLWWPEGFSATSERDFLALLEEMVQLGVLSAASVVDHFSLRNPNVLLLLGSKQEIENTLQAEREPRVEFESTIFRPSLAGSMDQPARNPLTYRQLDEVMQLRSSVLLVAASDAAGGRHLLSGLRDQPGMSESKSFVLIDRATGLKSFEQQLDKEVRKRDSEGITVMLVPAQVPWDTDWIVVARGKVNALTSKTSFVSVVFAADPARLWALAEAAAGHKQWAEPWLSVLPWNRGFVRKWLEELQLSTDADIDRLELLTGHWGGLLESAANVTGGALDFAQNLDRLTEAMRQPEWRQQNLARLTGGIEDAEQVLRVMCSLGDGVTEADLVEFGEIPRELVDRFLLWAEPLGLVVRQAGSFWAMNAFARRMLQDAMV